MTLEERINQDLKAAMASKDSIETRGLRAVKAAILLANTAEGAQGKLTPETEIGLLQKLIKQRKDSAQIYIEQGRTDLAGKENEEIAVIERYLPQQLSRDEITEAIRQIIAETGAANMKDMGKVMGVATKHFAGTADNKTVAEVVKQLLAANQ